MATQGQLRRQARLLARIKFGGEIGALAQLLGDAQSQRSLSIHNARAGAGALVNTLEGIRPKISGAYDAADAQRAQGSAEAGAALAGLSGPVVDAIRASRAREAAGQTAASAGDRAAALTDVGARQAGAQAGAIAETNAAQANYRRDSQKIFNQLLDLKGRQGDYIASTTMDLTQKQRDQAIKEGNLDVSRKSLQERINQDKATRANQAATRAETHRHNVAQEGKGGKGGKGSKLTRGQQNEFVDKTESAADWARQLKAAGKNGHEIRQALIKGVSQTTSSGSKINIPAYPVASVNVAMDLVYKGAISPENVRRVKGRGVKIPGHWR